MSLKMLSKMSLINTENLKEVLQNIDKICAMCLVVPKNKSMLLEMDVHYKLALLDLFDVLVSFCLGHICLFY